MHLPPPGKSKRRLPRSDELIGFRSTIVMPAADPVVIQLYRPDPIPGARRLRVERAAMGALPTDRQLLARADIDGLGRGYPGDHCGAGGVPEGHQRVIASIYLFLDLDRQSVGAGIAGGGKVQSLRPDGQAGAATNAIDVDGARLDGPADVQRDVADLGGCRLDRAVKGVVFTDEVGNKRGIRRFVNRPWITDLLHDAVVENGNAIRHG